jgi:hypothetical protein
MSTNDEVFWIVVTLGLALAVILHIYYNSNNNNKSNHLQQHRPTERPALLKPEHVPGSDWFNEWLMLRPLNLEWRINHEVDRTKPYLGSSLHRYYS